MKNVLLLVGLMAAGSLFAQDKEKKAGVPAVVKNQFAKEFPGNKASWEEESGNYEAEFTLNGAKTSALYDATGHRKELETEIAVKELPEAAQNYLSKTYPGQKVHEAARIVDDKNTVTYEAEVKKDGKSLDVLFDKNGAVLKK